MDWHEPLVPNWGTLFSTDLQSHFARARGVCATVGPVTIEPVVTDPKTSESAATTLLSQPTSVEPECPVVTEPSATGPVTTVTTAPPITELSTEPAATEPITTAPPITELSTEPAAIEPITTAPPITELSTEPAATEPITTAPPITELSTEPAATEPITTTPPITELSTEPAATEPITTAPPITELSTEPAATEPVTTVPPISKPTVSSEPERREPKARVIETAHPATEGPSPSLPDLFGGYEMVFPIPEHTQHVSDPVLKKWLQYRLYFNTRSPNPDGRPLYAYKITDKHYAELTNHVAVQIKEALKGERWEKEEFAPLFCLYAAETFCRIHSEGPWKWETIFMPLHCPEPEQKHIIYKWVKNGLYWWKRKIITHNRKSWWLRTLACEGGLPLELLRRNNDRLTRFFSVILEECIRQQRHDADMAEQIAINEKHYLSAIFHQYEIFRLAGILIAAIIRLQKQIGTIDADTDVMALLEQRSPDWKNELPMRVDDDTVKRLLAYLVRQSAELAQTIPKETISLLCWRGRLKNNFDGWRLEKWLDIPAAPTARHIVQWLAQTGEGIAPARWVLCLNGREMAWLSRQPGVDTYHLEFLHRSRAILLSDATLAEPHHLTLYDPVSHQEYSVQAHNSEPWSQDLPWVFVERNRPTEKEWLTEGSARVQNRQAWVVVQPDVLPLENRGCQMVGKLAATGQFVYEITDTTQFSTGAGDRYQIECRAASNSQENFAISDDNIVSEILHDRNQPIYRGIPKIVTHRGAWSTLREGEWRPVGDYGPWRGRNQPLCRYGQLWIGLVEGDTTRFRRMVRVVPEDFRIERVVGEGKKSGIYRLFGLHGAAIEALTEGAKVREQTEEHAIIACEHRGSMPLPRLVVKLYGLDLSLPWPQRGADFELAGRLLSRDDLIPVSRMGGLKLRLYGVHPGERIWLNARIGHTSIDESLQPQAEEVEINLHGLGERIHALLASSTDLDARVRLIVEPSSGQRWASVEISHFDLHVEWELDQVRVTRHSLARLECGWEQRVQMEMIPLWCPNAPQRLLSSCLLADGTPTWIIPANTEPGPWWIVGRDGDWARFRPLLWSANGDLQDMADARLEAAIREPDPARRAGRIQAILSAMGSDPDHPDWELLVAIIQLTREFPPSTLDVVKQMVHHPRTLQMALLRPEDPDNPSFGLIWLLAERLPFSWALLPVQEWYEVAECYFNALHEKMKLYDPDETFNVFQGFRQRATNQRKYWSVLCDWLQERLFPERPVSEEGELQRARKNMGWVDCLIKEARQQLDRKHSDDQKWQQSNVLDKWHSLYFSSTEEWNDRSAVYNLPLIVASISTRADLIHIPEKEKLIYQMRLIRHFDSYYFNDVYPLELTRRLANMRLEK
ncbi:MAG: STY4851/ECs_5259 family protein [Magnetococcus sp. YQC-5]